MKIWIIRDKRTQTIGEEQNELHVGSNHRVYMLRVCSSNVMWMTGGSCAVQTVHTLSSNDIPLYQPDLRAPPAAPCRAVLFATSTLPASHLAESVTLFAAIVFRHSAEIEAFFFFF